jgi:hypothetical protein
MIVRRITICLCALIVSIAAVHGKDIEILGAKFTVPDTWSISPQYQGIDSVGGKIQTNGGGFSIGWSAGPGTGDIVEQRSKDGNKVVVREELKKGTAKGVILIVETGQTFEAYATVGIINFYACCNSRAQADLFAGFIRTNFQDKVASSNAEEENNTKFADQDSAGHPVPDPESKSEDKDKPQLESKPAPR